MAKKKLSIIIPAFKDQNNIRLCLQSLSKSTYKSFSIIVVDHGSTGEITQWITVEFPGVICLRATSNLWWSGATNLGVRHALMRGSDLIMLLNHDCYVRRDTISSLLENFDDDSVSESDKIIAPVQNNVKTQRKIYCATSLLLLGFPTIIFPYKLCKYFHSENLIPTGLIIGGRGVIIDAKIFEKIGYFDEKKLPHYGADHDFYLRCRKSGIKLFTCKDAIVDIDEGEVQSELFNVDTGRAGLFSNFFSRSSHRNIKDVYALFHKHYPLPMLAFIGVALFELRYLFFYPIKKISSFYRSGPV